MSTAAKALAGRRRPKLKVIFADEPPTAHPIACTFGEGDQYTTPALLGEIITFEEVGKFVAKGNPIPDTWQLVPGIGFISLRLSRNGLAKGSALDDQFKDHVALIQAERKLRYPTDD